MSGKLEVLAPAGSPEALVAAVQCGAAAVYLGVSSFNARQGAHNFTPEQLDQAVQYCHARDVRVHLALNTLIRDNEMKEALAMASLACEVGVDALIIQDLGLARCLHAAAPTMPLHASTQLSCHNPAGVSLLQKAGFSRVVLAREMSEEEIAACAGLGAELEVFVHGALCMSVSGQCYFSAMLGGRSGNRGACAQPCRLPFAPANDVVAPCPVGTAALSLKDNCLVEHIEKLAAIGVSSLKIEGRMKRPEYVAAAARVYSAAARGETVPRTDLEQLQKVFSRTGFTDGYFTGQRNGSMFGTRRKEDVVAAAGVLEELKACYNKETPRIPTAMSFSATAQRTTLTLSDSQHTVTLSGPGGEAALHTPTDPSRVEQQLRKTGGTPFFTQSVQVDIHPGLALSLAQINALRREGLQQLLDIRSQRKPVSFDPALSSPSIPKLHTPPTTTATVLRLATPTQWSTELICDLVFFPLDTPAAQLEKAAAAGQTIGIEIPRGLFGTQDTVRRQLDAARRAGAAAALCSNCGALPLALEAGLVPVGGFGLNITNRQALEFYREAGIKAATLSMELTFRQMAFPKDLPTGILVYGRQPLMLTRNCPRQCATGSCAGCHGQGLTDRTGAAFPVMCQGGCSEVLNAVPLYWGDRLSEVPAVDFHLYHFTVETAQQAAAVLRDYRTGRPSPEAITRGLYRRGVQ